MRLPPYIVFCATNANVFARALRTSALIANAIRPPSAPAESRGGRAPPPIERRSGPSHHDHVAPLARGLGPEAGQRGNHEAHQLARAGPPAGEGRAPDVRPDGVPGQALAHLPGTEPLVGGAIPPPVPVHEDPRIPLGSTLHRPLA